MIYLKDNSLVIEGDAKYRDLPQIIGLLKSSPSRVDMRGAKRVDTLVMVVLVEYAQRSGASVECREEHEKLISMVKSHLKVTGKPSGRKGFFYRLGEWFFDRLFELYMFFGFVGEVFLCILGLIVHPGRLRLKETISDIERMGAGAVGIVSILAFLIGVVIAYQSAVKLQEFGANIFIVDLVGVSIMRELAPLIVAILLAGRSASSYTAQIGIMQVTEEIDVIRTMGLNPFEVLVIPKIASMLVSLPLLVVVADIMGMLGGMVVAYFSLGVTFYDFIHRLGVAIGINTFMVGMIKAPIFAFTIAVIGCYKGFRTQKNVESIGENVTISVVDSIFAVIVIDAIFSVLFRWAGI